ncbi:MAG: M23 family metallopeptidase [Burkholderiaceae bacterium]|jgi:murein DD-endopeptidase MepM/ murein hydrolase activator NlpD|nr:M23 family metallopeptidase [Burkholderiaceae bacterium]
MSHPFRSRFSKVATAVAVTTALAAVTALATAPLRHPDESSPSLQTVIDTLAVAAPALHGESDETFVRSERIRRGETLASLLDRLGATDPEFHRYVASNPLARKLLQLPSGRTVTADIDSAGRVRSLQYRFGSLDPNSAQPARRLTIDRHDEGFHVTEEPVPVERQVAMGVAEIQSTLFAAIDSSGIPDAVASQIADILEDKIDFTRDLRRGDRLRVLYEMIRESDSLDPPVVGRVLALEFDNGRARHEAVWFDRGRGQGEYFAFDGRSLKRSFLRQPVEFSRISSGFKPARMHPILKYTREHKGTDFAAPIGTKVRSSGDGVIEFIGQQRGYGKVIVVKHRNDIRTLYAHLHGFANDLSTGTHVAQGEVIGYVGATGIATGPHLHYEFIVDGENVDPMTIAMPGSAPLEKGEMKRFTAQADALRTRLAQLDGVKLARFE